MEQIISNLLLADNEAIQKATTDLQEAFKRPETITALCEIAVTSSNPQIRQYSAVLLRKRLGKLRNWQLVPIEQQQLIKQGMLNSLMNEPEKSVRNALTLFVGVLVKHEFQKKDLWMESVLKFIFENCSSNDPKLSELGSSTFSMLTDIAPDEFIEHINSVCDMFTAALIATEANGNMATPVVYNILMGMAHLVPFVVGRNAAEGTLTDSIPHVIKALQSFAASDTDKFIKSFEILDNLADNLVRVLSPHVKLLIDFCLEVSYNNNLEEAARVKTIVFIGWLVRLKKKTIIKLKLIDPIVGLLFNMMTIPPEVEDEEEEYFIGDSDHYSVMTSATQAMDTLALHVPPEKLIPTLLEMFGPALAGDPMSKKAAYLCMAVIAEGCSDAICAKYMQPLLQYVKMGITDCNLTVRNAALFALGQFSEFLQPEISKHAGQILPILFEFLQQLCNQIRSGAKEPKHIDRMFYALETFCENLEDDLIPHLPILMERLFEALDPTNSVHLRELALSAVTATATAAKSNMLPYFPRLIEGLKMYLLITEDENICTLRPLAVDTLAALARTIGKENFLPLAVDTMNLGLTLLKDTDDPDLRRSCYNLFGSMSEVLNDDMAEALPQIVEKMIDSVRSSEGLMPEFKEEEDESGTEITANLITADVDDQEIDIETSDGEDDDDVVGYSVENAYLDEKEEAIIGLRELAEHTGAAFAPYIQTTFEEIYKLINYPQEDIRKVSIEALTQLIISLYKLNNHEGAKQALLILMPKLSTIIRTDEERLVVMSALEAFNELLKVMKHDVLTNDGQKDAIFGCILDVLTGKVACQFDEPTGDEEQDESEYDEAIIESAGDILPRFGLALIPQEFALYFGRIYMLLVQKIEKSNAADSQRAFAFGVLSECFSGLKDATATYFDTLLPLFIVAVEDACDEVRNNAVYGLGELVLNADAYSFNHYPQILAALSNAVSKEHHAGTLDNICGALARLVITNSNLVPLKQVLPVFVQFLPLREDFDENFSVFKCLDVVYCQGHEILVELMERVIGVGLQILHKKQYATDECRDFIFNFIKRTRQDFSDKFNAVVSSDQEIALFVQSLQ